VLFSALLLCICGVASAQTHMEEGIARSDSIGEVVIEGVHPTYMLSSPSPVQSLNGKELQRMSNLSVADAVRYFSGVQIKDFGGVGGLKTVNVRSMGTNHLGVFYDGIQLGNAQNGQIDLGKFSLDNMEAIDLYNAQKSDIFQSAKEYGSAGVIYLRSLNPVFTGAEKTKIRVKYRTAAFQAIDKPLSYGLTNPTVLWQQKLSEKLSSTVSAEWVHSNGRYKYRYRRVNSDGSTAYDTTAMRHNGDIDALRVEAGLNGVIRNGDWNVKGYFYSSERGLPGYIAGNLFTHGQRLWDTDGFVQGSFRKDFGKYHFRVNAKYAADYTHYQDHEPTATIKHDDIYRQQEVYLSAVNKYDILPFWSASLATDFQYNTLDANTPAFARPQRFTALTALASALDFSWMKMQASLLSSAVRDDAATEQATPVIHKYTPALLVSFKPFGKKDLHLRAFYKDIFRMPTFNDLYYAYIGTSALRPEAAQQWDAGFTYERLFANRALRRVSLQIDGYYNEVKDKIVAVPTSNPFRWQMMNLGRVEIRGVDAAANVLLALSQIYVTARLNYTFQKAQDFTPSKSPDDRQFYGDQIPYIPWHNGSAVAGIVYRQWSFNYSFIYVGERYNQKANIAANYTQPWYTNDLSLSKEWALRSYRLSVTAEVNNVLNQYYDVVLNYPMPGRNYKLTIMVNY
jgi:outer membrane cobalamin receptor